jgi:hypothetical protein
MHNIVIADTSFLIAIQKLQLFNQIKILYNEVYVTQKIAEEFKLPLPAWIIIQQPANLEVQIVLSLILDAGEASAIALAYDYKNAILIIDDLKARKEAIKLGFQITGTLGVLYRLKREGLISSLKTEISRLTEIGFRISPKIIEELLKKAGEATK